jgi:16S rRNA (guanine527-N7)-methyltransferase
VSDQGAADGPLRSALTRSQELGFIGSSDLGAHVEHALGFAAVLGRVPRHALDLGSGGGLPGLVLACHWPETRWVLLDGSPKRTEFLSEVVDELDLGDQVRVVTGRAEEVGHDAALRGTFDLVVSRSFGPPAVVAECAAPFLEVGGTLVVSEPRGSADRWAHPEELALLGLEAMDDRPVVPPTDSGSAGSVGTYQVLRQRTPCPPRYPRRVGIPAKRPLFAG